MTVVNHRQRCASIASRLGPTPTTDPLRVACHALDWWFDGGAQTPTSSVTGGGAIRLLEDLLCGHVGLPHALAVSSGSAALQLAVELLPLDAGAPIVIGSGWFGERSLFEASRSDVVFVDRTQVVDLSDARVGCFVLVSPTPGEILGLRRALPKHISIIADLAALPVPTWPRAAAGADMVTLSFGPDKAVDAGEGGAVLFTDRTMHRRAIARSQHPLRAMIDGVADSDAPGINRRIHPVAAVTAAYLLTDANKRSMECSR